VFGGDDGTVTAQAPANRKFHAVDIALADLDRGAEIWSHTPLSARRMLLARVHALTSMYAQDWVQEAARIKGLPENSPQTGEEWLAGPYTVLTTLSTLIASLRALERGSSTVARHRITTAPGGRSAVRILPSGPVDRMILNGCRADVWTRPGVTAEQVRDQAGRAQRETRPSVVGAVLGAGNVSSIPLMDALHELFAADRVVLIKLNPVTDPLLGIFQAVLRPLSEHGVLRLITGDAEVGGYLAAHPRVGHVHITGSAATHDTIVFGSGAAGQARKKAGEPVLAKSITSELGGVSPTIVLPGTWSRADLRFQAQNLVTGRLHNNGYNCVATQVAVIGADWPQKDEFVEEVRRAMASAPEREAFYPGTTERIDALLRACPSAERLEHGRVLVGPLDAGVSSAERDHLFRTEVFGPGLGVVTLPGSGREFLADAITLANEQISGTLGVGLIAHPATLRDLGPTLDEQLAELRYGCIGVNIWIGVAYQQPAAPWGAFPGHQLTDVGSGIGTVHNGLFLDEPERTVIRGPFAPAPRGLLAGETALTPPRPVWFVQNRTAHITGAALTGFAAKPSWNRLPKVLWSALNG